MPVADKIAACEFYVKQVSHEIHITCKFSCKFHTQDYCLCTCYKYLCYFVVASLIQIGAAKGRLKNFVIEPFIKHEQVCKHCFTKHDMLMKLNLCMDFETKLLYY